MLSSLLLYDDLEVAMVTISILNYIPMPDNLTSGEMVQICGAVVALFFRILEVEGRYYSSVQMRHSF